MPKSVIQQDKVGREANPAHKDMRTKLEHPLPRFFAKTMKLDAIKSTFREIQWLCL